MKKVKVPANALHEVKRVAAEVDSDYAKLIRLNPQATEAERRGTGEPVEIKVDKRLADALDADPWFASARSGEAP